MSEKHGLAGVLKSIGLKTDEGKPHVIHGGDAHALADFSQRLNEVLHQHPAVGGHLFLLDFKAMQGAMGEKWRNDPNKINVKIDGIVSKHLAPHDLSVRKDDVSLLVLFPSLNFEEGEIKAAIIAKELEEALLGARNDRGLVVVRSLTVAGSGGITSRDVPPVGRVIDQVTSRLTRLPASGQKQTRAPIRRSPPPRPIADDMPAARRHEALKLGQDYRVIFRPLLSVKTKVISTFLCIPVREVKTGIFISGYNVLGPESTIDDIFALDLAMAERVAAEVTALEKTSKRSLLALSVHFEVLADHAKRSMYVDFCQKAFKGMGKRIIFEITNLPEGIPQARLLEFVTALKPLCRTVIARFALNHRDFSACRGMGIHAVGVDVYNAPESEAELMRQMNVFSQNAHQLQLKTYVEGIRTVSLFTSVMTSGFDYIAGYAMSGVMDSVDEVKAFQLDSLYVSLLRNAIHPHGDH